MPKGFSFWGTAQNRRAQCLSMAIVHTGATCTDDDVDSVIKTAALFEDYIISGTKPAVGNGQPAGNSEPFLDTPADTTAAGEAKTAADDQGDTDAGAVSEIESEKRTVEQMLAHLAQFGLRLESQKIGDDGVDLYWKGRIPDSPLSAMSARCIMTKRASPACRGRWSTRPPDVHPLTHRHDCGRNLPVDRRGRAA
ncbi:hypothetical protein K6L44_16205 [Gluconacetobacter entanii]|uniref:hypothetical protein n=1 Tax=Gluconacetobacter entanii TaxID=108528 RepID=UPI001C934413|nr:hypothetical protein [Gluconacetobacter entanii]MBY4641495.1 hypothetical protein [Gluconacetobacter entanii]MCW4581999.1 hypothetical protein [Gluconacetobacter entanii]MCW4585259.1 hypothetical protein [Gluconacetobacter entanii]MCW4588836.1 hypothetical protein [Gluconacetobacter entanii]